MNNLELNIISAQRKKEKDFWTGKLSGNWTKTIFPYDYQKEPELKKMDEINEQIHGELFEQINKLSNNSELNIYVIFFAALAIILKKYTQNNEIIIGSPVLKNELETNTINKNIVVRSVIEDQHSFQDILIQQRKEIEDIFMHQNYPFEKLVEIYNQNNQGIGKFPLFDIALVLENIHDVNYLPIQDINMIFELCKSKKNIQFKIRYNAEVYEKETIERLKNNYTHCLSELIEHKTEPVSKIDIVCDLEKEKILKYFNRTDVDYSTKQNVVQLFKEQLLKTPYNTALVFEDQKISYIELDKKSDSLANKLLNRGFYKKNIGLYFDISAETIIAMWAVIKAGAVFIPIDYYQPKERIQKIIEDSNLTLIISNSELIHTIQFNGEIINIQGEDDFNNQKDFTANLSYDNLYVIYTSGSTGKPKGVSITHANAINYVSWISEKISLKPEDKTILTTSFAFDASYTQIFGSLLTGGELHLVRRETYLSSQKLLDYLDSNQITILHLTPTFFNTILVSLAFDVSKLINIRLLILGGEAIKVDDIEKIFKMKPEIQVMNHYGPTETTIASVAQLIKFDEFKLFKERPTIGFPISNTKIYIFNNNNLLSPIGIPGEICISGKGVGNGYIFNEQLTCEKFVEDPFCTGNKMYKSGDIGRWTNDGKIEYLGRIDDQIKLHGNRIELGEIEESLRKFENITDAVVVKTKDKNKKEILCAFYISNTTILFQDIRDYLVNQLPGYMIPAIFEKLDSFPMTTNGKVDKKKLQLLNIKHHNQKEFIAPSSLIEKEVLELWKETLGIENIGINESFFELGGTSFQIIELSEKIKRKFNKEISVIQIFENYTIGRMAKVINENITNIIPEEQLEYDTDKSILNRQKLLKLRTEE